MVNGSHGEMLSNYVGTNINGVMMRSSNENLKQSSLENELELMLRVRHNHGAIGPERDLNMFRSGSAPPTVEGSLTAVGSLFGNPNFVQIDNSYSDGISSTTGVLTEEEIRLHPAYLSYYYSHENLNPRLPPPLLSKEDWRVAQRFQSGGGSSFGGIGDLRKNFADDGSGSLFSMQPALSVKTAEDELTEFRKAAARNMSRKNSLEFLYRGSDGFTGGPRAGMGMRRKSFADILQAVEVVDVDQQTKMVAELNGSVMKCVRDQNGNHVIQKCIECVPQDRIQFIVSSFFGQVVSLSTHPYGCRVIQRVLEHCDDPNTQRIIMDEIMFSVCTLAQDQYGNYVIQHTLQHGKPHEGSFIIEKLTGQIVKMSQQKFASNVVEKCLTFGGPEERQLLVNEMLGSTDENEPLQAIMKDPFGNYVVQKVIETCDDQSRELILSRIKVHLNSLKRYTYGKHIVSRVEKLVTAGERHMAVLSSHSS